MLSHLLFNQVSRLNKRYQYLKEHGLKAYGIVVHGPVDELLELQSMPQLIGPQLGPVEWWHLTSLSTNKGIRGTVLKIKFSSIGAFATREISIASLSDGLYLPASNLAGNFTFARTDRNGGNGMGYIAAATLILLVILVLFRAFQLKKLGIKAVRFGEMDKKDFLIPPFALLLFYIVFSSAFSLPEIGAELFHNELVSRAGAGMCIMGILFFVYALISFGKSFRVGLDEDHPGELITTGAFSISRNPIYTAFGLVLAGVFLIIPNWIILVYVIGGIWLFNRQILLEEESLKKIYGEKYMEYCNRVRRFL